MKQTLREILEDCPIIAAVKENEGLEKSLTSDCKIIFVLFGNVCEIDLMINRIHDAGKMVFVHIDLIEGLESREISVEYMHRFTKVDGIITTKPSMIKAARAKGYYTILRMFVVDSMALDNVFKQYEQVKPDCIEILPGVMPEIIKKVSGEIQRPLITSGLIGSREEVIRALNAGAVSISTTHSSIWNI